jgi:hypothetical protein
MLTDRTDTTRPQPTHEASAKLCALVVAVALGVLALIAALSATSAAAATTPSSWSAPVGLSQSGGEEYAARLAVGPRGDAAAVWMHWNGDGYSIQAATRPAGGAWSGPATLSAPGVHAGEPSIAIDAAGDAVVAWQQTVGKVMIEAATHAAGASTWSLARTLSDPLRESSDAQAAIDPRGDAVVAFKSQDGSGATVVDVAAEQGLGGEWGAPATVSPAGSDSPSLGMDAAGDAFLAWRVTGSSGQAVQLAQRPAGGDWSTPTNLSPAGVTAMEPDLAVDAKGDVAVIWEHHVGANLAQVTTRPAGGSWTVPKDLSDEEEEAYRVRVRLDAAGDATAVWIREFKGAFTVRAATAAAGSVAWSAPTDLSAVLSQEPEPWPAVDSGGDGVVAWSIATSDGEAIEAAARKGAGGSWSPPVAISAPGVIATQPQVGIDDAGRAVAIWRDDETTDKGAWSADYDPGSETPDQPAGGGGTDPAAAPLGATPAPAMPPASKPGADRCPKGKALRKAKVRLPAKRAGAKGKANPRFKTVRKCVKPTPHHKHHAKHHQPKGH